MKGMHSNGMPARVLDALETDGGWLTLQGVHLVVGGKLETARRALERLRERDLVTTRVVEMAGRSFHSRWTSESRASDSRTEWKAV